METLTTVENRQEVINKAAEQIIRFFENDFTYPCMLNLVAEGMLKIWRDETEPDHFDGSNTSHEALWAAKIAYDLLRPFAALAGQSDVEYYYIDKPNAQ